MGGWGLAASV